MMTDRHLTEAERDALHQKIESRTAAAQVVEERVAEALRVRLNALIHAPLMMKNDERSRAEVARIAREVLDAEVPPPPFEVVIDMTTDPHRVQINFAYPPGPML